MRGGGMSSRVIFSITERQAMMLVGGIGRSGDRTLQGPSNRTLRVLLARGLVQVGVQGDRSLTGSGEHVAMALRDLGLHLEKRGTRALGGRCV